MINFFSVMLVIFYIIKQFAERMNKHRISSYSGAATLFLLVSFFPFVLLLLNLIKFLPFVDLASIADSSYTIISPEVSDFIRTIIREIDRKASGALISISTVAALWAASKGLVFLIRGLNEIRSTSKKKGYIRLRIESVLFTVIFLAALVLTLVLLVFGGAITDYLVTVLPEYAQIDGMISVLKWLFQFMLLVLFFSLFYAYIPQENSSIIRQLPGAVVASGGWLGFSALYSLYITHFGNYSYLYGSFAIIILLVLWLYFCVNILFFGAELNAALYDKSFLPKIKCYVSERLAARKKKK